MNVDFSFLDADENIDFSLLDPGNSPASRESIRVLESVLSEIATLAGPISTAASLFNAAEPARRDVNRRLIETILPPEPVVYSAVVSQLARAEPSLVGAIQHFHVRLAFARKAALATPGRQRTASASNAHMQSEVLADVWRELCHGALDVLDRGKQLGLDLGHTGRNLPRLRKVLEQAAAGGHPCVGADGSIEIPGIAERRQQPRYPVSWQAWISTGGDWIPVTLFDISRGGAGATGTLNHTPGEAVSLLLHDREMSGRVAWAVGPRFAVQLDTQLDDDDALIQAARAGA